MVSPTVRDLVVRSRQLVGQRTVVLDLAAKDGGELPEWTPGSHIELLLDLEGQELIRQFSLCGESRVGPVWRIAVLREAHSRGGSALLCDRTPVGTVLRARGPRNNFPLAADGRRVILLAAGIGITPIISMALEAESTGLDWRLLYLIGNRADMVLTETLARLPAARVHVHCTDELGRMSLREWTLTLGESDAVFACGPSRLLDDLAALNAEDPRWRLRMEHFENLNKDVGEPRPFSVVLRRSGKVVRIGSDETILGVLSREGMDLPCSCRNGVCGACEQVLLEGKADHRDAVLSPEERQAQRHIMICVSRALTPSLTLDL